MLLFLSLFVFVSRLVKATPNYVDQADLLFDISLIQNSSSNGIDFHISMASHFGPRSGWIALGTGNVMKGSLMFIMYPTEDKSVALTVRTASGHAQPKKNSELPAISVLNSFSTDTEGAKVDFICYSCDQWQELDATNSAQEFIWAKRRGKVSETNLGIHQDLGHLKIDMKQAFSTELSYSDPPAKISTDNTESDTMLKYVTVVHGIALGVSFMALYPIGAIVIHHSYFKNAFTYHWICQLSLSAACFATAIFGVVFSGHGVKFRNYTGMHQILGILIFFCLIVQILMGFLHHLKYLRSMRRTWVSHSHIWLGKVVLALGVVNVKLGLNYSGAQEQTILAWWMWLGLYIFCLFYIVVRRNLKKRQKSGGAAYTLLNI